MKINAYTIFDKKSGLYNKPFYLVNHQVALRSVSQLVTDENSECAKNPEDYSLWFIGEYDDENATFASQEKECIALFHEVAVKAIAGMRAYESAIEAAKKRHEFEQQKQQTKEGTEA
ncbi:nonstructural protein [Microviridae sp.]|nr:nonstructural protein [Microviridae sp.]